MQRALLILTAAFYTLSTISPHSSWVYSYIPRLLHFLLPFCPPFTAESALYHIFSSLVILGETTTEVFAHETILSYQTS